MNYKFLFKKFLPEYAKISLVRILICCGYKKEYRGLWLISERGNDARDNGYFFFRYLRKNYPEISCRYVITDDSADLNRVQDRGYIRYQSLDHYAALLQADKLISSHIMGFTPEPECCLLFERKKLLRLKGKQVFLQHGITKDDIEGLKYPNIRPDLFICGARQEFEYITKTYRHPAGVVQYTGLARYDTLTNIPGKRMILIMPTWRKYLNNLTESEFIRSDYYKRWNDILSNLEIKDLLEANQYRVVFYPHYEMQKYLKMFHTENPFVRFGSVEKNDVQGLLRQADILITDYSSVYFDFAYMTKPIIFYQFDRNKFFNEHYAKGYFDENTFGNVVQHESDLIYELKAFLKLKEKYNQHKQEQKSFFGDLGLGCCERIYRAILAIDQR